MIVLALDLSTKSTGWSIFENQTLKNYGCITASSSNVYHRMEKMQIEVDKIIKEQKPDNILIEEVIPDDVRNNNNTFKMLMYLQGFIMKIIDDNNLSSHVKFYTASEWRKKCGIHTGRGVRRESLKPKDIAFVKSQFNLTVNDDVADAICIGFAAVGGVIKQPQVIIDDSGFEFA